MPYAVQSNTQNCDVPTFCIPLAVALASPIDNVKGYDVVINYDATKLVPTGNVTITATGGGGGLTFQQVQMIAFLTS